MMLDMLRRFRVPAFAACFISAFSVMSAAASAQSDALAAFGTAVDALRDYTVTITVHEMSEGWTQDRVVQYWYKKPTTAKVNVLRGSSRGSVAVWNGGDTVRGRQGGLLRMIALTVGLHDSRATSLRGDTIDSAYFGAELKHFKTTKGEIAQTEGGTLNGIVDIVTLRVADPAANRGVTKEVLYLSHETHLPVQRERFEGDASVKTEIFSDLQINPGLTDKDFVL
jgi:outer membrane lipoprotein-sorting protein